MYTDQLTGCFNRDALVGRLARLTAYSRVLVMKLDIARFHEINSGYGYDLGDALLRVTAQRLTTLEADLVARVGSDQFALAFAVGSDAVPWRFWSECPVRLPGGLRCPAPTECPVRHRVLDRRAGFGRDDPRTPGRGGAVDSKASPLRRPREFAAEREAKAISGSK